jgi:hypothetical protein
MPGEKKAQAKPGVLYMKEGNAVVSASLVFEGKR